MFREGYGDAQVPRRRGRCSLHESPMDGPPSGTRSTLGRAALTGGGEHRAVGRTWAAAADSDLLWAPLPEDDIFTFESVGRCEVPTACPCHHTN